MKIKRKFELILDVLLGEKNHIADRLNSIYGHGKHLTSSEQIRKENAEKMIFICIVWILLIILNIYMNIDSNKGVNYGEKGIIQSIQRPEKGEKTKYIKVRVVAVGKNSSVEKDTDIRIDAIGSKRAPLKDSQIGEERYSDKVGREIESRIRKLNEDTGKSRLMLPKKLDDGTYLFWKKDENNNTPIMLIMLVGLLYLVYKRRFSMLERLREDAENSVKLKLPEVLSQIVILLKGGMIFSEAFYKTVEEHRAYEVSNDSAGYFLEQLDKIAQNCKLNNASLVEELTEFSKRIQVADLLRVTGIIRENISKGTDLTDKLEDEAQALWFARKKRAEAGGSIAETKLTVPLAIDLIVLVIITIAPAMIEM